MAAFACCSLTRRRLPASPSIVPSRQEACYACYDHFLGPCTISGEPFGYPGQLLKAWAQLGSLLQGAGALPRPQSPLLLAGFSKGAVVLNQLLSELAWRSAEEGAGWEAGAGWKAGDGSSATLAWMHNLAEVHYLDAGLNTPGAYITSAPAWAALGRWRSAAGQGIVLRVHSSPRQREDAGRPWIREELRRMLAEARRAGVKGSEQKYCEGQEPSMAAHFEVLSQFLEGVVEKVGK